MKIRKTTAAGLVGQATTPDTPGFIRGEVLQSQHDNPDTPSSWKMEQWFRNPVELRSCLVATVSAMVEYAEQREDPDAPEEERLSTTLRHILEVVVEELDVAFVEQGTVN